MEDLIKSKQFKTLFIIFIVISAIHILFATLTYRGLYMDSSGFMLDMLNSFSNNKLGLAIDPSRSRFSILLIQEVLVVIAYHIFTIKNKFILMGIYSFAQIAFPFLILIWNYYISKRTGKINVFYWSLMTYGILVLPCLIFSVVETHIGIMLHFILWNYLVTDIDYKKRDIIYIILLLIIMCGTYEYVACIGIIFFIAYMFYNKPEYSLKQRIIKSIIGFGSLYCAIYNIIHFCGVEDEMIGAKRFINELYSVIPQLLNLNTLLIILAILLLFVFFFKKTQLNKINYAIAIAYFSVLIYLLSIKYTSLSPMWEGHLRTFTCVIVPVIFIWLFISDKFFKTNNNVRTQNFICIIIMLCIFQTLWQIVETSYWRKNIMYMKEELAKNDGELYIPSEHEELISDFNEPNLRRFIWHWVFINTSILFADEYKPKTILMNYDKPIDEGNVTYREYIYVPNYKPDLLNVPPNLFINQKNEFWDLTDIARAIDKYNKEHNIKTDG